MILVLEHNGVGRIGTTGKLLTEIDLEYQVRTFKEDSYLPPDVNSLTGLIVLGGGASVNDDSCSFLKKETSFVEKVLSKNVPTFGICLGAQLVAKIMGAKVEKHPEGYSEIGYFEINGTDNHHNLFSEKGVFYQWHSEGFAIPDGAKLVAEGEFFKNQAYVAENLICVQFHPEIESDILFAWMRDYEDCLDVKGAQNAKIQLDLDKKHNQSNRRWYKSALINLFI